MKKNIEPLNNKNQRHGYWETYWRDGNRYYKGNFHNGKQIGYWEIYSIDTGELNNKEYYII